LEVSQQRQGVYWGDSPHVYAAQALEYFCPSLRRIARVQWLAAQELIQRRQGAREQLGSLCQCGQQLIERLLLKRTQRFARRWHGGGRTAESTN